VAAGQGEFYRSYENYPDSNKLFKSIDSKGGLVAKDSSSRSATEHFDWLQVALLPLPVSLLPIRNSTQAGTDLYAAVNKLISHPVFAEWLTDPAKPTKFSCRTVLGLPWTPARVVRSHR
jgi:hypothetical protein